MLTLIVQMQIAWAIPAHQLKTCWSFESVAYGYFLYQRDKVLTEVAENRLQAIKEFTELGSGFKIAMRDLSIRGQVSSWFATTRIY